MKKFFEGSNHAALYAKYRPELPEFIAFKIIQFMKERNCAFDSVVDIGCGNGQSTKVFSSYFSNVLGIDTSTNQIEMAKRNNANDNVTFEVGNDSHLPACDDSVDLITSTMAVHWFDFPVFFEECKRVLKKNGCLFLCGHNTPYFYPKVFAKSKNLTDIINLSKEALLDFDKNLVFDKRADHLTNHYAEIFDLLKARNKKRESNLIVETTSSLGDFASYLSTWSPYQSYLKNASHNISNSVDILNEFTSNLKDKWNMSDIDDHQIQLNVFREYFIILSEKPS